MAENHFIVSVVDAETDTIRIPDAFTQRNGEFLNHSVTLRTRDYTDWVVHVDKTHGEIWLTVGLKEFAKENGIKNSFLVHFKYVGDTVFLVIIYRKTGCENPGPDYPIDRLPTKFFTCLNIDDGLRRLKFPEQFSTLFDGRLENPFLLLTGDGPLRPDEYREITQSYRRLVLDAPQLTLWTTKVTDYILAKSKPLYIPAFVVKEYFSDKPEEMEVMLPSGKVEHWKFIWSSRDTNEGYLGHGWYDFVTEYQLKLKQKIRFFMADLEDPIHVEVI